MKKLILLLAIPFALNCQAQSQDKPKCEAKTKANEQCSRSAQKDDTKCYQHSDKSIRCGAATKAGTACKVVVKEKGLLCHNHKK